MGGAHDYTGRFETHFDAVVAKVAFVSSIGLRVDVNRVIRACIHAPLTTNAAVVVEVHHPIGSSKQRRGWTNVHTRCILTLVATHDRKVSSGVRELALFDVFNPSAIYTQGDIVFALTRDGARVAPNASLAIEKKSEASHRPPRLIQVALITANVLPERHKHWK